MCHQIDSCAAKSEKLQLLLSQIGFFFSLPSWSASHFSYVLSFFIYLFLALTKCAYFSVFYWEDIGNYLIAVAVKRQLRILSVSREGNIRLRLLIDVHLNRQTSWHMMHFKFTLQCYCSLLVEKKNIQSKPNCALPTPVILSYIVY